MSGKEIRTPRNDITCPSRLHPCPSTFRIDWILNHMTMRPSINIGSSSFSDLVHADDTAFFVKDAADATESSNPADLMESFTYLGSIQTSDGYCRSDIARRIGLESSAMSSLNNIWNTKHLSIQTKVRVCQTLVLSILLYASETWTSLASDMKVIESFHMKR